MQQWKRGKGLYWCMVVRRMGGGVKVGWDRIVKGKKFVHRHIGVIFFRKIILKGMGKMAGKGKERHIYVYLDGR